MKNHKPKPTHPEKTDLKKRPRLQPLQLEQLDGVAGGPYDEDTRGGSGSGGGGAG